MYIVDNRDLVRKWKDVPQSSVGAPLPLIISDEHTVAVAYYAEEPDPSWDGTYIRVVDATTSNEPIAIVVFRHCYALLFGPPNDEAFRGHPLASRGLAPYGSFIVENSSWVRQLEVMNAVHPHHDRSRFMDGKQHFVLSFHDSTFECVAKEWTVLTARGSLTSAIPLLAEAVFGPAA